MLALGAQAEPKQLFAQKTPTMHTGDLRRSVLRSTRGPTRSQASSRPCVWWCLGFSAREARHEALQLLFLPLQLGDLKEIFQFV